MVMTRSQLLAQALQGNNAYQMGNHLISQGSRQAYSPGQALGNALTSFAGYMGRNKGKEQAETETNKRNMEMARMLAGAGINVPQGGDAGMAMQAALLKKQLSPDPVDMFETVSDPFGKGGVGQKNTRTGQIVNYQPPEKAPTETWGNTMEVSGPDGKPMLVQVSNMGGMRPVEGYGPKVPEPKNPFGNNSSGNLLNVLNTYSPDSNEYRLAYVAYGQPKTSFDPTTGQMTSITPDMSAFRPPSGMGGDPNIQQAGGMPGAGGATVQPVAPPKAPAGYRNREDGTLEPIPGGPEDLERQEKLKNQQRAIADAEYSIKLVDDLINHPAMQNVVGMPESMSGASAKVFGNAIPGTPEAGFIALLRQIEGRQFLQAFEGLKGAGQITEIEGAKASAAMSRLMETGQSEEDYLQAAQELKAILNDGLQRARGGSVMQRKGGADQPAANVQSGPEVMVRGPSGESVPRSEVEAELMRRRQAR